MSPVIYDAGKALGEITSVKRTNGFLEWMGRVCQDADFRVFFLVSVIGMALVLFIPFVEWLSMKREARGRGIGRRGMEHMMGKLAATGAIGMHLQVSPVNRGAQAFYRKLGFEVLKDGVLPRHTTFMVTGL